MRYFLLIFSILFSFTLSADVFLNKNQQIMVEKPWARATIKNAKACGVFLEIHNNGLQEDRLIKAESPVAKRLELHDHVIDKQGIMKMREVTFIPVSNDKTTSLRPGSLHVMFFGLKQQLIEGESFPMMLYFENAGKIETIVKIQAITSSEADGDVCGCSHGE